MLSSKAEERIEWTGKWV